MGGATRVVTLLTAAPPPLRRCVFLLHRRLFSLSITPLRLRTLSSSSKPKFRIPNVVNSFHSQATNNTYTVHNSAQKQQQQQHPWPEWTNFLNIVSNAPEFSTPELHAILPEDAFVVYEEVPDEFVRSAAACLAFARARPSLLGLLSRRDIEAVVSNGTPFLFRGALDAARRIRAFLRVDESNVSEFEKTNTVDLMKYILSYASNPTVSSGGSGLYSRELVDSSVRNLLHELGLVSFRVPADYVPNSGHQFSGTDDGQTTPFGQNNEMKRGDWICQRCNFMNFARNTKCLECEETRSRRQLTGREWECPQCNFFNYRRNLACLRCDCRRPGAPLFNSGVIHHRDYSHDYNIDTALAKSEEKAQQSLSEISQVSNVADMSTPFPTVSHEQSFQHPRNRNSNNAPFIPHPSDTISLMDGEYEVSNDIDQSNKLDDSCTKDSMRQTEKAQADKSERWLKRQNVQYPPSTVSDDDFPEIMPMRKGENRFVLSQKKDRSLTSPKYKRQVAMDQADNSNFVPFVPFPPGYFAQKDAEKPRTREPPINLTSNTSSSKMTSDAKKLDDTSFGGSTAGISSTVNRNTLNDEKSGLSEQPTWSLEGSAVKEPDPLDMSEEAKAERWFKRVAHIKDISELSQIPDEDFPSIMPMRKGVNGFVVSKRKTPLERRLTSKQYRNQQGK